MARKISIYLAAAGVLLFCAASVFAESAPASGDNPAATAIGMEMCLSCHADYDGALADTPHRTLLTEKSRKEGLPAGCEACHGAGSLHLENPGEDIVNFKNGNDFAKKCLTCHGSNPALARWEHSDHRKGAVFCNECHSPHKDKKKVKKQGEIKKKDTTELCATCHPDAKAQFKQPSHHPVPEKKMDCASCHNPHDENTDSGAFGALNQTCVTCHTEKAGPFRFQHDPVAEDCLACHKPHGSAADKLQAVRVPNLCVQCHSDALIAHQAPSGAAAMRNCLDCHKKIHGSNGSEKLFY